MRKLRAFWIRLCGLLHTSHSEDEFQAELASHLAMHTEDGIRAGLDPEEARRQALLHLGGVEQTRQAYRERRGLPWLETLAGDVAYSLRRLRKHPAATAIAVLSIGLGIGANGTIFSMVSRFVLRPAPVGDPSTLLAIQRRGENALSRPLFEDLHDQVKSFSAVAGYFPLVPASIASSGEPERVFGQAVTANFFEVAQLNMMSGRGFAKNEEKQPLVVLGAGLWHRRFQGDPEIVGKTITLSGQIFTVVGIAPAGFHGIDQIIDDQFWVPLGVVGRLAPNLPNTPDRSANWLFVVGRLRSGVTRTQAAAELDALAQRLARSHPAIDKDKPFIFAPAGVLPPAEQNTFLIFLTALSVVALLVLAIAAANVANLLFAQASGRQREMAVRLALGATRGRLQRQMLVESVLLGLGGGVFGVLLSLWATQALSSMRLPISIPVDMRIAVDGRVLIYTFVLSLCSGLLLGVAPAWAAARPLLGSALKGEDALARPGRRWSLRTMLTVAQIGMSVILLSMTGLFLRSLQTAAGIDIGFRPENRLSLSVDPRLHGYSPERTIAFLKQLQERIAALPGVVSAVSTDYPPLSLAGNQNAFHSGSGPNSGKDDPVASLVRVTPGYFETMGIPRLAGRDFADETATGAKVAIVNETFAKRIFGAANPIAQHVTGDGITYEIVGVVGDVKVFTLGEDATPVLYRSLQQDVATGPALLGYTLLVHTAGPPSAMKDAVRRQVHALDPSMAVFNEETMEEHVHSAFFLPHLAATLFGVFGILGLVLASVGLYGVTSYAVSRRTHEIGIRMALGAQPGTVERLILRQGLVLTLIAVAVGLPAAWMLSKLAASFLYGIQPHDPLTFLSVPPFLTAIALLACWMPARRAASIEPMQALRSE
jgi:putative ABC transport system permease protein